MSGGHFNVSRKIFENPIGHDLHSLGLFIYLLSEAKWKPVKTAYKRQVIELGRGQGWMTKEKIQKHFNIGRKLTDQCLNLYQELGVIEVTKIRKNGKGGFIYTICKYEEYQSKSEYLLERDRTGTETGTEPGQKQGQNRDRNRDRTGTEKEQQEKKDNKEKKGKKEKKEKNIISAGSKEPPRPSVKKSLSPTTNPQTPGSRVWVAYAHAYKARYGEYPVSNARQNSHCSQLVQRLGEDEAPLVAEFYVHHNNQWYVQNLHPLSALVHNAEKFRTEWKRGAQMTSTMARESERVSNNREILRSILEEDDD